MFSIVQKKKEKVGQEITLKLSGMHCTSCALNIDATLEELNGVIESNTNYAKSECQIAFDEQITSLSKILEEIEKAGYQAKIVQD